MTNDRQAQFEALLDRDAIRAALVRLARGEDRRDAALIRSACWPDSVTDYGVFRGDFAAYLAWVVPGSPAITNTQHVLGQSHIELAGETARVETQVISYHRIDYGGGDEHDTCIGGRYLDHFERREGDWRLAARTMLYDWSQDWGAAADWSQGLMGMAFRAPHFAGRATGDWSERFFGGEA
ncbi:nuclear transport factor 2 family protein [Novosphingobium piscinae]|uniref:Nuclear transport factor 2 family protein n=1 Tax=Novosphingobium piscinae TaxID=1507448 RepID=A0A7X1FVC1_9SPHN|nr:nuclear transport factor 2 family protein [Novosphingobium piscinae]MBC2667669.1 nuclear transport factor 2 family protein [Novosphingobium piscinae]